MASVNPLLIPPRLVFRALDDLNAIAEAARALPEVEARLTQRVDALDGRLAEALDAIDRLEGRAEVVVVGADARLDEAIGAVQALSTTASEVGVRLEQLSEALPTLESVLASIEQANELANTALALAGPLEGVVERLGAIADRLPAPRRRRAAAAAKDANGG